MSDHPYCINTDKLHLFSSEAQSDERINRGISSIVRFVRMLDEREIGILTFVYLLTCKILGKYTRNKSHC